MAGSAGGFALAEAFVRIRPDAGGFRAEADKDLKAQMAGDKVTVPVDADTAAAVRKVADLEGILALLGRRAYSARIITDDAGLQAELARITTSLRAVDKLVASPKLGLEGAAKAEATLLGIGAQLDKLSGRAAKLHVDIDDTDAERRLALLITELSALQQRMTTLQLKLDDPDALAKIAAVKDAMAGLADQVHSLAGVESVSSSFIFGLPSDAAIGHSMTVIQQKMKQLGLADIADVNIDPGRIATSLMRIKGLLARTPGAGGLPGLADLMDVNIPPGTILTQLARLKSALGKTNLTITDIMDVNLSPEQVQAAVAKVQAAFANIPAASVSPSLSLPSLAEVAALRTALASLVDTTSLGRSIAAISQELKSGLGGLGDLFATSLTVTEAVKAGVDIASWNAASKEIQGILDSVRLKALTPDFDQSGLAGLVAQVQSKLDSLKVKALGVGVDQGELDAMIASVQAKLNTLKVPLAEFSVTDPRAITAAETALSRLDAEVRAIGTDATAATGGGGRGGMGGLGLAALGAGGWFGFLTGNVRLFGGALAGVPFLGAIGTVHLLADAVLEIAAVVIPAGVALAAFGAGAASTFADIARSMQTANTVSIGLGQNIYPLTGQLTRLTDAVHPAAITLWGEALVVAGADAGRFTTLAVAAGRVIDNLGARAAVALTSGGLNTFMKNGAADLAVIGDIVANIFGTIGNVLKTVPGYAQILFGALDGLTKALEAVTGSPIGQWLLTVGLALHGAIIWIGLGVTATVLLGNAMVGLAAKFGLAEAGALSFDAVQFGSGIATALPFIATMGAALIGLDTEFTISEAAAGAFEGIMVSLGAINPLVWVGIGVTALAALVYWLTRSTSATAAYDSEVNKALGAAPVSQLGVDLSAQMASTIGTLSAAEAKLATTTQFAITQQGTHDARIQSTTEAYKNQAGVVAGYRGELGTLQKYQENYNTLIAAASGNLGAFSAAGITSNDILNAGGQQIKQYVVELQAQNLAFQSLSLGAGRAAAAQNALGKAGAASFDYITSQLPQLQKITQAEDTLAQVLLGGEQAFTGFQQSLVTLGTDLGVNAAKVLGFNTAQLTVSGDIYSTVLPAFQKTLDAAQQMGVSTGDLTKITATQAGEFLKLAGGSATARVTMVGLINNALGPGTVSLKTLDSWVAKNSTSQAGLNTLWSNATLKAGTLSGILQNSLNVQFHQALLTTSGASAALVAYTGNITHNTTTTAAGQSNRARLIQDLINSGLSAKQARAYVDGLSTSVGKLPSGKTIRVMVDVGAAGTISAKASGTLAKAAGLTQASVNQIADLLTFGAAGMRVPGSGSGDTVPAMLTPGEAVVPKRLVPAIAPFLAAHKVPGFAAGGLAGDLTQAGAYAGTDEAKWAAGGGIQYAKMIEAAWVKQVAAAAARAAAQAAATRAAGLGNLPLGPPGPLSASAAVAQAFARSILFAYGWTQNQFPPLQALWNQECLDTQGTQVLTKRGWLAHDEVRTGDETIGYNPVTGRNEWTRIERVVHYDNAEVWEIGHSRWHARVTPGHKWWNDRRENHGRGYIREWSGFTLTCDLTPGDRIRLAAPADTDGIPGLSREDVAVLAWMQGDGYIKPVTERALAVCPECGWTPDANSRVHNRVGVHRRGKHGVRKGTEVTGYDGRIYQSKPEQVVRVRALLAGIEHTEIVVPPRNRGRQEEPEHVFLLRRSYVTDLLKRSEVMETGPEAFVLRLSPDQRAAWLAAMIDAEGSRRGNHTVIYQNRGSLHDAVVLAAYLEGFQATAHADRRGAGSQIGLCEPHVSAGNLRIRTLERRAVFCLTTKLGSWTAQQDGQVFLTGNSGWNSYAVNPSSGAYGIPQSLGHGHPYNLGDYQAQIRWGLAYISTVYGSPANAWAHEVAHNWYGYGGLVADQGTTLSPGWNVRYNGTGRPEALVPAGGGKTDKLLQCLIDEVRANTQVSGQQGHRFASALNSVSVSAGQRGSYSTRR